MHRIDQPTAVGSLPTPAAAGTPGYFSNATPGSGTPTIVDNDWCNDIQEELIAILTAAGTTPSKTTHNQVLTSLQAIFTAKGVVGSSRNLKASLATAGASVTYTADEIIVETALGGSQYQLASFNQALNTGTTGAGGMDTGACPTSGFLAVYAIYDPTTNTQGILGVNATSGAAPNIYGGAHMPTGYTASALIGVIPTNSTPAIAVFYQADRQVSLQPATAVSSSSSNTNFAATPTSLSISGIVPANAKTISGIMNPTGNSASATVQIDVMSASSGLGIQTFGAASVNSGGSGSTGAFNNLPIITSQTMYYRPSTIAGTNSFIIEITGYTI